MDALPPHPKHWYFGTKLVPPKLNSSSVYKSGVCLFCRYAHWTIGASSWWQMGHIYQTNPFDFPKGDRVDRWTNKHHQPETHTHSHNPLFPNFFIMWGCQGWYNDTQKRGFMIGATADGIVAQGVDTPREQQAVFCQSSGPTQWCFKDWFSTVLEPTYIYIYKYLYIYKYIYTLY